MQPKPDKLQDLPLAHLKAHPEIITDLLDNDADVSVLLQKHGDRVRFGATRAYSKEAIQIVDEARAEHAERKRQGYGQSEALADFESFQRELAERVK